MPWPFEQGHLYNRREHIHAAYGGQQQGGIITPAEHPLVIAITGEEGHQHGYADRLRDDGVFEYFGEGQVGPMQMQKGNLAIAEHSSKGESLLLFRKEQKGALRYLGEWVCGGIQQRQAPDTHGVMRQAFVFELDRLGNIDLFDEADAEPVVATLADLRAAAMAAAQRVVAGAVGNRTVFQRSQQVRKYVLARAGAHCEGCGQEAPFVRRNGSPYLEPHHLRRVSDGGPDDPRFVIGLCPTCHRRVHFGRDGETYNEELGGRMTLIEVGQQ